MVQRNRDIEQDLRDIAQTRERLTEKIELLRSQIRGAARQTQYQLGHAIDDVRQTAEGLKRTFNPSYQLEHHPWAITAGVALLGYMLAQWGRNGSRTRGNGHLFRETGRSFYDHPKNKLPGRS